VSDLSGSSGGLPGSPGGLPGSSGGLPGSPGGISEKFSSILGKFAVCEIIAEATSSIFGVHSEFVQS
jgi:hypothetical protein